MIDDNFIHEGIIQCYVTNVKTCFINTRKINTNAGLNLWYMMSMLKYTEFLYTIIYEGRNREIYIEFNIYPKNIVGSRIIK